MSQRSWKAVFSLRRKSKRRVTDESTPAAPAQALPTQSGVTQSEVAQSELAKSDGPTPIAFDLTSHHALGGGSYVYKKDYHLYLQKLLPLKGKRIEVNLVMQPNSSPHLGTLCNMGLTFVVASRMQKLGHEVLVMIDLSDQGQGEQMDINGVRYQKSLRDTGELAKYLPQYEELLKILSKKYNVKYELRFEEGFLQQPGMSNIIQRIVQERVELGKYLMPSNGRLSFRAACPKCGLTDKGGIKNEYSEDGSEITFLCPEHGKFKLNVHNDTPKLQYNTQLLNLIMGRYYEQVDYNWIEVCGSDYAGFWQEQLLWRFLSKPVIIVYTPLIVDWSGSKISKSAYLQRTAYDYLIKAGLEYLLSYDVFRQQHKDLNVLWKEIELWFDEPYRLFRSYSLHYMHLIFTGETLNLGTIH
jgi:hypothetical protein